MPPREVEFMSERAGLPGSDMQSALSGSTDGILAFTALHKNMLLPFFLDGTDSEEQSHDGSPGNAEGTAGQATERAHRT